MSATVLSNLERKKFMVRSNCTSLIYAMRKARRTHFRIHRCWPHEYLVVAGLRVEGAVSARIPP